MGKVWINLVGQIFLGMSQPLNPLRIQIYIKTEKLDQNPQSHGRKRNAHRDGILRERREHARGRNLADCGRICGSLR